MYKELADRLREHAEWAAANEWETPITLGDDLAQAADAIDKLQAELERVKRERDAAMDAIGRMAEYIVTYGRVDEMLCDDIPRELHLKYQPLDDGNYDNEPCIECVREYFMRRDENQNG